VRAILLDLPYDLRFAFRSLRRSPVVAATIVLCLGFGIGATGTVFAWLETMVLQPLTGVRGFDRLVSLKTTSANDENDVSYPDYKDIRDWESRAEAKTFDGLALGTIRRLNLRTTAATDARLAAPLWAVLASANYFDVLGVRPVLGRTFAKGEDAVERAAPVVVISHALWRKRFGGDPDVIGRQLWIGDVAMTIVGVAPADFYGTISHLAMDLWIPITMHPAVADNKRLLGEREARWFAVFGRLAPGATLESARASAQATGVRLAASFAEDRGIGLTARVMDVGPTDRMAPVLTVMLAIAALVLLIVCSNVANLLLQRGAAREHELAVRLALGARTGRIVRQLMTESAILAAGAVLVGVVVLNWARNALNAIVLPASPLPIVINTPIDGPVLLVLAGAGAATLFLFGLAPAMQSARVAVRSSLAGGSTRGGSRSGGRVRGVLIAAQFALALAVLFSAGLFLRRLDELRHVDRGFRDPQQVLLATVDFEMAGVRPENGVRRVLTERLVERLSTLPGVRAAAAASFVPLGFLGYSWMDISVDGYVPQSGESTAFLTNYVSGGYFELMGIPIKRGRPLELSDRRGTQAVAVVNEAFARRFWGAGDPIGRGFQLYGDTTVTIVGVAADGKYEFLAPLDAPSPPFIYLPIAQWGHYEAVLHVRTDGDPMALVPSIQHAVSAVDARLTAMSPGTLENYTVVPLLPILMATLVLSVLGGAALVLAAIGQYAVTAYAVTQQRREIGIRMALGATRARVVVHLLGHSGRAVAAGAVAGVGLSIAVAYVMTTRLPAAMPTSSVGVWRPFAAAALALGAVAVLAVLVPAGQAARMNPTTALREE
jgi:predicted permease